MADPGKSHQAGSTKAKPLNILEWRVLKVLARPSSGGWLPKFRPAGEKDVNVYPGGERMVLAARRACMAIADRGWADKDSQGWYRLNDKGKESARTIAEPEWTPPKPKAMDRPDWILLTALAKKSRPRQGQFHYWVKPADVEAEGSEQLMLLVRHGYAEARCEGGGRIVSGDSAVEAPHVYRIARAKRQFRASDAGLAALKEYWAISRGNWRDRAARLAEKEGNPDGH
jgi:hypothetical protein